MRSGGVVGLVQEKVACDRKPVPIRHPQPLSQGLTALPAPLTQGSQAPRGDGASSEKKRSPAADAGLGCKIWLLLRVRTGGSGGHFALGKKAPRRPFCPLSAGGKWTPFSAPAGAEAFDRLGRL